MQNTGVSRYEADVWHVQLYMWGQRFWQTFASSHERIELSARTNICLYARTLFFAFLSLMAYVFVAGYLAATFMYYPSVYFGWDYWQLLGKVLLGIIALIAAMTLLFGASEGIQKIVKKKREKSSISLQLEEAFEGTSDRPSIFAVAKQYVDAQSQGFCSAIEIVAPVAKTHFDRNQSIGVFNVYVPIDRSAQVQETQKLVTADYITANRITFLPVWWKLALVSLASATLLFILGVVSRHTRDIEVKWEGECKVREMVKKESHLELNLVCNGKSAQVFDSGVLLTYVNDHKNPRCFADIEDNLYCEPSDRSRMKQNP